MDDVVLVAVVHAREDLLDQEGGVTLGELTAGEDLVEELSTLADLLHDVVAFVVFEELEHLDNVGVIQFLKNVNLVEEHAAFILIHVRFTEHLHGTLCCSLAMHAHSNLAECTVSEDLTDTVKVTELTFIFLNDILSSDIYSLFNHCVTLQ
jgi:hypothetical protein